MATVFLTQAAALQSVVNRRSTGNDIEAKISVIVFFLAFSLSVFPLCRSCFSETGVEHKIYFAQVD